MSLDEINLHAVHSGCDRLISCDRIRNVNEGYQQHHMGWRKNKLFQPQRRLRTKGVENKNLHVGVSVKQTVLLY